MVASRHGCYRMCQSRGVAEFWISLTIPAGLFPSLPRTFWGCQWIQVQVVHRDSDCQQSNISFRRPHSLTRASQYFYTIATQIALAEKNVRRTAVARLFMPRCVIRSVGYVAPRCGRPARLAAEADSLQTKSCSSAARRAVSARRLFDLSGGHK